MARRKKSVADFDAKLDELRAQMKAVEQSRKAALQAAKGLVGETALNILRDVPTDKAGCKAYFKNLAELIKNHQDEFYAMNGEAIDEAVAEETTDEIEDEEVVDEEIPDEEEEDVAPVQQMNRYVDSDIRP